MSMLANIAFLFLTFSFALPTIFGIGSNPGRRQSLPKSEAKCGENQVFHNETGSCYYPSQSPASYLLQNGPLSPCGQLMYFYQVSQNYGECHCISDDNCHFSVDFNRPILNWPGSNRCYFAFDQGPCKSGEWIVLNKKTFRSECKPNPCLNKMLEKPAIHPLDKNDMFWFTKNGTCYQTYTQAYCIDNHHVRFLRTNLAPFCAANDDSFGCGAATTTARAPCPQGHKRVGDDCTQEADFM